MSESILPSVQKILCARSGNRCAFPDCRKILVEGKKDHDHPAFIGFMAHIVGKREGSARYDPDMPINEKNSYDNLLLVCGSCHKKIDSQEKTFTVKTLHKIKNEHEKWIESSIKDQLKNVTFSELDVITKYLLSDYASSETSFHIIPPKEKIEKNFLSASSETLIKIGLTQVKQVEKFIDDSPDIRFGERLKTRFVSEYEKLKNEDLKGDELFTRLFDFASDGANDFKRKAAGLAVLVYLFESCEVFEK